MEDYAEDADGFGGGEEEVELTVPRGGPLYVENLTGPLSSVPLFQSSILQELQDLEVELASGSSQLCDEEDISVDELKILSEEELVDMAIKDVLKEDECAPNPSAIRVEPSSIQGCTPVHYPEVALSIEIYHNVRNWVKTQEFLVLGRQTLTEFRDKIYCLTDKVMERDGQHNRSGYFLIEDTFYNDLRDPSAIDYSKPIFDWLNNSRDEALKKWECILAGKMQKKSSCRQHNWRKIASLPSC